MKLLEIRHIDASNHSLLPEVAMVTDSSIVTGKRPVFLPEISERWELAVTPAYRISRLGKSIPERFAPRYFDAVTLAARAVPLDLVDELRRQGRESHSPLATAFDYAVAIGSWIDPTEMFQVTMRLPQAITVDNVKPNINQAIAYISKTFILKNGDIIVPGEPIITIPVKIGDRVEAAIGSEQVLAYNIK